MKMWADCTMKLKVWQTCSIAWSGCAGERDVFHPPRHWEREKKEKGCQIGARPSGRHQKIRGLGQRFGKPHETLAFPQPFCPKPEKGPLASHALFHQSVGTGHQGTINTRCLVIGRVWLFLQPELLMKHCVHLFCRIKFNTFILLLVQLTLASRGLCKASSCLW